MRYHLIIKQCVQLVGYGQDVENTDPQMIMVAFQHNDKNTIALVAKGLRTLHSNTEIVVYDSVAGKKIIA